MKSTKEARMLAFNKIGVAQTLNTFGLNALLCDADTVWLRDPSDFFSGWASHLVFLVLMATHERSMSFLQKANLLPSQLIVSWFPFFLSHPRLEEADVLVATDGLGVANAKDDDGLESPEAGLRSQMSTGGPHTLQLKAPPTHVDQGCMVHGCIADAHSCSCVVTTS